MPANDQPVGADQATSELPGTAALRTDKDGKPLYAEWDDSYAWNVAPTPTLVDDTVEQQFDAWNSTPIEDTPDGGESISDEEIYDPTPLSARQEVQQQWDKFRTAVIGKHFTVESLLEDVEKIYSTAEAATFFGRSNQWMYWGLRRDKVTGEHVFTYKDGTPIQPERIGPGGRRRFKLPVIREIALSCYRRGNLSEEELTEIMGKILIAEFGERAFADT